MMFGALGGSGPGHGETWDAELAALASPPCVLQSWGFGEVQAREGWRVERLRFARGRATALLRGAGPLRWAYVPRGPVPASTEAVAALASWARERRLARLRVEPEAPASFGRELGRLGFRPAPGMQPTHTVIVPLGAEAEMLARLKPKHRYNLRLAWKRGVTVEVGTDAAALARQARDTELRQRIRLPSAAQYRTRIERLEWCRVYVAWYRGEAAAAVLVARFAGRATYLFGGSSGAHRQVMPAYAAQWAAMRDAANAGCRDYDLWGVPPSPDPGHPWHGLWQFKTGFGGRLVEHCGAWDLVLAPVAARLLDLAGRAKRVLSRTWVDRVDRVDEVDRVDRVEGRGRAPLRAGGLGR